VFFPNDLNAISGAAYVSRDLRAGPRGGTESAARPASVALRPYSHQPSYERRAEDLTLIMISFDETDPTSDSMP
jgi:hypothetical protein